MKSDPLCKKIELILTDVDGVLTDGYIVFDNQGIETKQFFARDGFGIALWRRSGHRFGILTSRTSHIVQVRADELGIEIVRQGFEDKLPVAQEILGQLGLSADQVCYVGDDLTDVPVMKMVGFGVAVADAAPDVRNRADYVTKAGGGRGAVRETIELILKSQRRWENLIQRYVG